jgi:hypothetical protein
MSENRINIQRYAMVFGTYMGIYWIIKFICFPLGFTNPFFSLLFLGLTIAVPFMGYRYARIFRDKACNGTITFLQSWLFMVFMYMFAALLAAVAHFIYFRFIDNGFVINSLTQQIDLIPAEMPQFDAYADQIKEAFDIMRTLTPIEITMQLLSQNFLYCSILSLITAPFVIRNKTA